MDQITKDEVEKLKFPGSASNGNNALRTLRRMYSKAKEDKLIFEVPDFALFKERGRSLRLNDEAERRLSAVAEQPLLDIIVVMRDTGTHRNCLTADAYSFIHILLSPKSTYSFVLGNIGPRRVTSK